MDQLDKLIAEKRRHVERLKLYASNPQYAQRDLVTATAELEAFETAASLRPLTNGAAAHETESEPKKKRGGKPAGAISEPWRNLLRRMYADGNPYRPEDWILVAAKKAKINADDRSVLDRLSRKYVNDLGFLEYEKGHGFRVTNTAVERFKLDGQNE